MNEILEGMKQRASDELRYLLVESLHPSKGMSVQLCQDVLRLIEALERAIEGIPHDRERVEQEILPILQGGQP